MTGSLSPFGRRTVPGISVSSRKYCRFSLSTFLWLALSCQERFPFEFIFLCCRVANTDDNLGIGAGNVKQITRALSSDASPAGCLWPVGNIQQLQTAWLFRPYYRSSACSADSSVYVCAGASVYVTSPVRSHEWHDGFWLHGRRLPDPGATGFNGSIVWRIPWTEPFTGGTCTVPIRTRFVQA